MVSAKASSERVETVTVPFMEIKGIEGGFVRMVDRLLEGGTLTGDPEADAFLRESGEAVLLGLLFDQRVRAEYAFTGPVRLHERLGHLDMKRIARIQLDTLRAVFAESPAVHRFTNKMAEYTRNLAEVITNDYAGLAANVWSDGASSAEVQRRIGALPGFGKNKAAKSVYVLHYFGHRDFSRD